MTENKYCIYLTTNKINGKTYVGQHKYKKLYDGYIGSGAILKRAIKKYGKENFEIEYLEIDVKADEIDWYEQWYITVLNPYYNISKGGQGVRYRETVTAQESRIKNSEKNKANWADPDYRAWMMRKRAKRRGISLPKSEEVRRKLSKALKGRPGWNKGMHWSEETRRKISEAQKGRKKPHEGVPRSAECRAKIAEANRRRKGEVRNKWWNDGFTEIKAKFQPSEDFVRGRLKNV